MSKTQKKSTNQRKPQKKKQLFKRVADGIYRHRSGGLYWRPIFAGVRTWQKLEATRIDTARAEVAELKKQPQRIIGSKSKAKTMGQVIEFYEASGYPDKFKGDRPEETVAEEKRHCALLMQHWRLISINRSGPAECDRYHTWRVQNVKAGCKGNRTVDRELNTLNNACRWAARCEFITFNPMADRPRYQKSSEVKHCREFKPQNADELHASARHLFQHPNTVVLGFQMLGEANSGLRTCEVLEWGDDVFGTRTEDGKNLHVWRCKGQHDNNPYVACHDGMETLLTALASWLKVNFGDANTFFPSHCGGRVSLRALSHALLRLFKKGKLKRKITSHGMRAFYVLIRRSQGASDEQIAHEIGHTSNGLCIKKTYGSAPDSWRNGGAPNLGWLPSDPKNYAWAELEENGWKFPPQEPEAAKLAA